MEERKEYVLVHGYIEYPSDREFKPDINSRLQALAASEYARLNRRKGIQTVFVITQGTEGGATAMKIAQQINRNLGPRHNLEANGHFEVIVRPFGTSTEEEVKHFRRLVAGIETDRLLSIGRAYHLPRMLTVFIIN